MPGPPAPASFAIAWRRLDQPAYEAATLAPVQDGWVLAGDVRGDAETGQSYALRYVVRADAAWRTGSAHVEGLLGRDRVQVVLARDAATGTWTRDGVVSAAVTGCLDVDLAFTPATNTLAIRRLSLAVGESAAVRAAWLGFPSFAFEALDQVYTRETRARYRYESGGGSFQAQLEVDEAGLVRRYGDYWVADGPRDASLPSL